MSSSTAVSTANRLLSQLINIISANTGTPIDSYAVLGRLVEIQTVLNAEHVGEERVKRVENAKSTRKSKQTTPQKQSNKSPESPSEEYELEDRQSPRDTGYSGTSSAAPVFPGRNATPPSPTPPAGGWATVARKANKAKPGNVPRWTPRTPPKQQQQSGEKLQQQERRRIPEVRINIFRKADRDRLGKMSNSELIEDLERATGESFRARLKGTQLTRRGELRVYPEDFAAEALLRDRSWVKRWIPASGDGHGRVHEIVVRKVVVGEDIDKVVEYLQEQNERRFLGLEFGKAEWMGNPTKTKTLSLKVEVNTKELANRITDTAL